MALSKSEAVILNPPDVPQESRAAKMTDYLQLVFGTAAFLGVVGLFFGFFMNDADGIEDRAISSLAHGLLFAGVGFVAAHGIMLFDMVF
jgi:hypothetical protein